MKTIFYGIFVCMSIFSIIKSKLYSNFDEIKGEGGYLKFLHEKATSNSDPETVNDVIFASIIFNEDVKRFEDDSSDYQLKVIDGTYDEEAPAYLKFTPGLNKKGWDFLTLSSYQGNDERYSDDLKSYAMGYLEGVVTADKIWNHYTNQKRYYFFEQPNLEMPKSTRLFLQKNAEFIREMGKKHGETDPYWYHAIQSQKNLKSSL